MTYLWVNDCVTLPVNLVNREKVNVEPCGGHVIESRAGMGKGHVDAATPGMNKELMGVSGGSKGEDTC